MSANEMDTTNAEQAQELEHALVSYYVVADFVAPAAILDRNLDITWYSMESATLAEIETRISLILEADHPVFVVALAYQAAIHENVSSDVMESIEKMQQKAIDSGKHKFSCSTLFFTPDRVASWDVISQINQQIRTLAINSNMQPLCLHKVMLKKQKDQAVLCVDPKNYLEFLSGSSLGSTFTRDAIRKIVGPLQKHLSIGMHEESPLLPRADPTSLCPTPPGLTTEYLRSPSMLEHLRQRGLFIGKTTPARSLSRPRPPKRKPATLPMPSPATRRNARTFPGVSPPKRSFRTCSSEAASSSSEWSSRASSSGSSSGYSSRSRSDTRGERSKRRENQPKGEDLEDLVFLNSLSDGFTDISGFTDNQERYSTMMTAYGRVMAENADLKMNNRDMNKRLLQMEQEKRKNNQSSNESSSHACEGARRSENACDRKIYFLEKEVVERGREKDEALQDFYRSQDEVHALKRQLNEALEAKVKAERSCQHLRDESKTGSKKSNKDRSGSKDKKK